MKKIIKIFVLSLLFLLPWQKRLIILPGSLNGGYFEYGSVSLYATEIILWLIVALLIIQYFSSKRAAAPGIKNRLKIFALFFVLCAYILIAHPTAVTLNYVRLFLEGILLILIIFGMDERIKFVWAFVAGAALQAILGIWQFFSQTALASKWLGMAAHDPSILGTFVVETVSGRWLRAYGALPHPNILAGYLVAAVLLVISEMIFHPLSLLHFLPVRKTSGQGEKNNSSLHKEEARMGFGVMVLPILFAGLFFTFSRSAWIALAVGIIILVIAFRRDAINRVFAILPAFAVILFLLIIYWPLVVSRTVSDNRLEIKSLSERIGYYGEAWTLIKNHPLLGVGLGNYTRAVHDEINPSRPAYSYQPVHNIFFLAFAELGALGILIIVAGLYFLRKIIFWKKTIYFLLFIIIGLFDHYLWSLYPGIILWAAYLGLIL